MKQRQILRMAVAWCPDCLYWLPKEDIGARCVGSDCPRKLVKRRKWVCLEQDCHCSYKLKADAMNHQCGECY
jgi:hypothetical protein